MPISTIRIVGTSLMQHPPPAAFDPQPGCAAGGGLKADKREARQEMPR